MKIDEKQLKLIVKQALEEDLGTGDVSAALLPSDQVVQAEIISREPMLLCGQPWVNEVFLQLDPTISIHWLAKEGEWLAEGCTLCQINGHSSTLLSAERTALNFLQTLSGTATQAYQYVQALKGTQTQLLDTRKTIPGLRMAQKYAVACAGGKNHRFGLYDAYLIKENHIKACGSITKAVALAREQHSSLFLEVEVESIEELKEALQAAPDRILLDNFPLSMLKEAVLVNKSYACELEASGGVDLTTIQSIAATGVHFISVGTITKSVRAIDLSLLIREVQ